MENRRWPCRSWLISTVENPDFLEKQSTSEADAVLLELEAGTIDKARGRLAAAAALRELDYGDKYRVVRVNPWDGPHAVADIEHTVPAKPDAVMLTKIKRPDEVVAAASLLDAVELSNGLEPGSTDLVLMIETASAVLWIREIASASNRITALCFGGGDYTADIHTRVTIGTTLPVVPGLEILMARSMTVTAARAVGASPIDVPLGNIRDSANSMLHGFQSRALGFDGMIALSPTQVSTIHEAFTPSAHEIAKARRVVGEFDRSQAAGRGVIGVDGEMVSDTIAEWYRDTLRRAGEL